MRCHNLASLQQSFMNDPHVTACPPSPLASPLDHLSPLRWLVFLVSGARLVFILNAHNILRLPSLPKQCFHSVRKQKRPQTRAKCRVSSATMEVTGSLLRSFLVSLSFMLSFPTRGSHLEACRVTQSSQSWLDNNNKKKDRTAFYHSSRERERERERNLH